MDEIVKKLKTMIKVIWLSCQCVSLCS